MESETKIGEAFDSVYHNLGAAEPIEYSDKIAECTRLSVSTITVCCRTPCDFSVDEMCERLNTTVTRGKGKFYNSIMFTANGVHGKLFPNGQMQFAGCKAPFQNVENTLSISTSLLGLSASCENVRIAMINSNFDIGACIHHPRLMEYINSHTLDDGGPWIGATKKGRYPGVNAKFVVEAGRNGDRSKKKMYGQVSVLIFQTGSIIITGYSDMEHGKETYDYVTEMFRENTELLFWDPVQRPKPKKK